jgi:hypothetical protein
MFKVVKGRKADVWAQLWLCAQDRARVRDLLASEGVVKRDQILPRLHVTVYHARRPMPGLLASTEPVSIIVPIAETRFMVLTPGGENRRPELEPAHHKVGIRIQKKNSARDELQAFRDRLLRYESKEVLGIRRPSTHVRNAFGARWFHHTWPSCALEAG